MIGSKRTTRGFTLIELMIATAVVAVLAAIAYPSYQQYVLKSRRSDAKTALLDLASRQERYYSVNNAYTNNAALLGYGATAAFPLNVNVSGQPYYQLSVTSVTAGSSSALPQFVVSATPVGTQVLDTACYGFRIDSLGRQSSFNASGAAMVTTNCW